jgi:hypothetical protein
MRVFVIMGNDYPSAVFTDEGQAMRCAAYLRSTTLRRIYYRCEMDVPQDPPEKEWGKLT